METLNIETETMLTKLQWEEIVWRPLETNDKKNTFLKSVLAYFIKLD